MGFTISYNFQGSQKMLECNEEVLCGHDAVYYALLHSGVEFRNSVGTWQGSYPSIVNAAEQSGVSNVMWHRSDKPLSV